MSIPGCITVSYVIQISTNQQWLPAESATPTVTKKYLESLVEPLQTSKQVFWALKTTQSVIHFYNTRLESLVELLLTNKQFSWALDNDSLNFPYTHIRMHSIAFPGLHPAFCHCSMKSWTGGREGRGVRVGRKGGRGRRRGEEGWGLGYS